MFTGSSNKKLTPSWKCSARPKTTKTMLNLIDSLEEEILRVSEMVVMIDIHKVPTAISRDYMQEKVLLAKHAYNEGCTLDMVKYYNELKAIK